MIELPIFHHTDESAQLTDLGIEFSVEGMGVVKPICFININAFCAHKEGNHSIVFSNNTEFICELPYEELKTKLNERRS